MATVLNPIGRAYVRLLQMAIVPYITVSLIACPGRIANHYLKTVIWTVLFLNATFPFLPCSALLCSAMKDLLVLLAHLLTTVAKLMGPGGARAVVAQPAHEATASGYQSLPTTSRHG
jgi:L-cystine uptake protein TcyP (sodium:dicarboxylate symporter family)